MTKFENDRKKLSLLSDEDVVALAQSGDMDAFDVIVSRYQNFVLIKAKQYFLIGGDNDDVVQEGFIGLYKAVKKFNGSKFRCFKTFATVCVNHQILSAIKKATRQKHGPLNSYISLNYTYNEETDKTLLETISLNELNDPESILINRENTYGISYKINKALSRLELKVLICYLEGKPYKEIAENLNKDVKAIDNAVQRIRKKLENILEDDL